MESLLFVIIIGIISVLFGKVKTKQSLTKNNPRMRTTFEEIRTQVKKQLSYLDDKKTSPVAPLRNTNMVVNNLGSPENKYLQLKQESNVKPNRISNGSQKVDNLNANKNQEEEGLLSLNPDEKTLINGIIWSEILGEPRSKKPYSHRKG